jgi:hypothetical protein
MSQVTTVILSRLAVAWLYVFMALLFGVMATSLGWDVRQNHYSHRPMRPLVIWIALMMAAQSVHFVGLATARFYRYVTATMWLGLDSPTWVYVHFLMTMAVVGFYATFRSIRRKEG